ncbi:MAG: hypothetical protein C0618_01205 [Desulfuromonas sp.]|nr:MAG: hypothetical protein C0618_01205 [Desulfuromonas sp.]
MGEQTFLMKDTAQALLAAYPLEQLLQTIPTGLFLVDSDMRIAYWNEEAERITGFSAAEVVGQHCSMLEGIPCGATCGLFEGDLPKPITGAHCSIRHRDGHRITLNKNMDLLRDASGKAIGGIEAFVDISRLSQLEEKLRNSARSLRRAVRERTKELEHERTGLQAVLDGMLDPTYICTGDYRIEYMNCAMRKLIDGDISQPCYKAIYHLATPCKDCALHVTDLGLSITQERTLGQQGRTFEVIHSPLPSHDTVSRKLGVCRDITERLQTSQDLEQTNQELDAFVSMVSHDLRTPLTPIIGFSEYLQERYADKIDQTGLTSLHEIEKAGHQMLDLLEDLLTLAQVGRLDPPETPVPPNPIIDDILHELQDAIRSSNATIQIEELPALLIPAPLIMNLFRNLLSNALRYAIPAPRIEISAEQTAATCLIHIRDHGPGIPVEERQLIFDTFKRGSTSKMVRGTGLGLATVQKIVRTYQGRIHVEDTPGGGATFVIELPAPPHNSEP